MRLLLNNKIIFRMIGFVFSKLTNFDDVNIRFYLNNAGPVPKSNLNSTKPSDRTREMKSPVLSFAYPL